MKTYINAFYGSHTAIGLAHKRRNVLHRDISIGNIMFRIRINAQGILADWDHSALDETDSEHQNFRTVSCLCLIPHSFSMADHCLTKGYLAIHVNRPVRGSSEGS